MKKLIKKARDLATLHHKYDESLDILKLILKSNPKDVDALILTGNILDLKVAQLVLSGGVTKKFIHTLSVNAEKQYLRAFKIEPENPAISIDLGDYYSSKNKNKSLRYYNRAIKLLKDGKFYVSLKDELEDAYEGLKALQ